MVPDQIMPMEEDYHAEIGREGDRFKPTARQTEIMETLKNRALSQGLWNFWLTGSDKGYGLTTVTVTLHQFPYLSSTTVTHSLRAKGRSNPRFQPP